MRLRGISEIASTTKGLSPTVRAALKTRAIQSLVIAFDCAIQLGRDERYLTTNRFIEALAERWSEIYRQTRKACGTGRLRDFRPETARTIRKEIVGQGIAYQKLWKVICDGVPELYKTSAPIKDKGRKVTLEDEKGAPLRLLEGFDRLLDDDPRYRRVAGRAQRLLLAGDKPPSRKIAQHVGGERPFDIMHVGPVGENMLARLEAARVFLRVPELLKDIEALKAKKAASGWPAIKQAWDDGLQTLFMQAGLDKIPGWAPPTASAEKKFWATVERWNVIRARKAFRARTWRTFLTPDRDQERNRYRTLKGRLAAMEAIQRQLHERGIAADADIEIKSAFYKHRTRRFQAVNVWPAEASSGEENVTLVEGGNWEPYEMMLSRPGVEWDPETMKVEPAYPDPADPQHIAPEDLPTKYIVPQRIRWFKVRSIVRSETISLENLSGLDVSGSQAQILAVVMGLRDLEEQLHQTPFKKLVALSIRSLQKQGRISASRGLLANDTMLENVAKGVGMPALYGGRASQIAHNLRRDPDRYESGLNTADVQFLFDNDPTLRQLRKFLDICEAVGHAACETSPTAGVTVEDPLDRNSFTWNPPKRVKVQVGSGAFKLYIYAPVLHENDPKVDEPKLVRRIAPGLIHMLDALYASIVVSKLNELGVRDVVAIHDAFLVPVSARGHLSLAINGARSPSIAGAGQPWLMRLGPFYEFFERYLPASTREGQIVRQWRDRWEQRKADCEAGKDTWPKFLTKHEGSDFR
jgi:hypothetical protein